MPDQPAAATLQKIGKYVSRYRAKSGTTAHPDPQVTEGVVPGLAANMEQVGRPLCPCNFSPDKQAEVDGTREWVCACDEMKQFKFCHCLLFVTEEELPVTEHLPADHEGRQVYGMVKDPTPDLGREARHRVS